LSPETVLDVFPRDPGRRAIVHDGFPIVWAGLRNKSCYAPFLRACLVAVDRASGGNANILISCSRNLILDSGFLAPEGHTTGETTGAARKSGPHLKVSSLSCVAQRAQELCLPRASGRGRALKRITKRRSYVCVCCCHHPSPARTASPKAATVKGIHKFNAFEAGQLQAFTQSDVPKSKEFVDFLEPQCDSCTVLYNPRPKVIDTHCVCWGGMATVIRSQATGAPKSMENVVFCNHSVVTQPNSKQCKQKQAMQSKGPSKAR
jgi:hypothetical protein